MPDDRKHLCQVTVDEKFDSPVFHENILSSSAGGLAGAGGGALAGLVYGIGPQAIVTVPLGALIGAVGGTACAAAGISHPNAEADFARLLQAADAGALKRALETDLNAPRPECGRASTQRSPSSVPDTVIEIETIDAGMGCALGRQDYWVSVQWRTLTGNDRRVLAATTTRCSQKSFHDVDDWFANPDRARMEIQRVLAMTGQRMAAQLISSYLPYECTLQSIETGEVVAK
jgi:hypothetical protein